MKMSVPQWRRGPVVACGVCGQAHLSAEPHVYDYTDEVDEDLLCQICLQALVLPTDTRCGHTFCQACLVNYLNIQPLCPLDRTPLTPADCQLASLMVRRLLDKLTVKCPYSDDCGAVLPRSDLEDHLKHRCPGSEAAVSPSCGYQGPRKSVHRHQPSCLTLPNPEGGPRCSIVEGELCKIQIQRPPNSNLGMSIVGGYDSPLRCTVIQEVTPGGIIDRDNRLKPGDQLVEVNGDDLTKCTHMQACTALLKSTPILLLMVYRDRTDPYGTQPGMCNNAILRSKPNIRGSLEGGSSGLLTGSASTNDTSRSDMPMHSRSVSLPADMGASNDMVRSTRRCPRPLPDRPLQPKYFTIIKLPNEILGISVAGGLRSQLGDTPIYVTDMQPQGCLGRSKQIKKGDILLSVNGRSLLGIAHSEAIAELKGTAGTSSICLGVIEGPESSSAPGTFMPSWMYWQSLPRTLHMPKTVTLQRNESGSLGFSIVGGKDSAFGDQPIHILLVVHDSPAATQGKLKCGDQILSVNGHRLDSVTHSTAVAMLKQANSRVSMEVLSWPGTQV